MFQMHSFYTTDFSTISFIKQFSNGIEYNYTSILGSVVYKQKTFSLPSPQDRLAWHVVLLAYSPRGFCTGKNKVFRFFVCETGELSKSRKFVLCRVPTNFVKKKINYHDFP